MFFLSQPYVNVDIRNARTHVKNGKTLYTDYEIKVQVSMVTIDNMKHESATIYMYFQKQSRPHVFCRKDVLRNFATLTRRHLRQSLFFNKKYCRHETCNFIKKETLAQVFFCEIFKNTFFTEYLRGCFCITALSKHRDDGLHYIAELTKLTCFQQEEKKTTKFLISLKSQADRFRISGTNYFHNSISCKTFTGRCSIFFSIRVFFTDTDDSQGSRGREGIIFYSTLPLPPAHEHWDIYLHVRWLSRIFNRNACVYQTATRWDLPPYRITIWVIDWWCNVGLFIWWIGSRFLLQRFGIAKRWIWTCIDYHPLLQANQKYEKLFLEISQNSKKNTWGSSKGPMRQAGDWSICSSVLLFS